MARAFFPKIEAAEFQAFQAGITSFPATTYDEWHIRHEVRRLTDWEGRGHIGILIDVSLREFREHCARTDDPWEIWTLDKVAWLKGERMEQ